MAWYDVFANFYDACLDGTYRQHRIQATSALALAPGMTVVDVGCGTGASFPHLVAAVGPEGRVVGVDASAGMLRKATARVQRSGWTNVELRRVGEQPGSDQPSLLEELGQIDRVLCFLSLTVIPEWQAVLEQWFAALTPGGRLVIADVYNERPGPYARLVELISRGTLTRRSWAALEERASDSRLAWQDSSWALGGRFFVAEGTRA